MCKEAPPKFRNQKWRLLDPLFYSKDIFLGAPSPPCPGLFLKSISSCTRSGVAFHGMPLPENKATPGIKCSTRIPWGEPLTCSSSPDVDPPATDGWREHPAPQPEIALAGV